MCSPTKRHGSDQVGDEHAAECPWEAPSRPRRDTRPRDTRSVRVSPRLRMGVGWLSRRRPLLRPVGVPHHEPARRGVARDQEDRAGGLLGPPCAPVAPGAASHARRPRRVPRSLRPGPARRSPRGAGRRHRHRAVRGQLAPAVRPPVLLRRVRRSLSAPAHVVARHRGAVLSRLATRSRRAARCRSREVAGGGVDGRLGRWCCVGRLDGLAGRPRRI